MNRKNMLLCGAALASFAHVAGSSAQEEKRPNIVLIMVDDMGYSDIGCYGGEIPTPNIDKLAQAGVRFTHFCNTGRSCPSRASLLTGLYPHQAGIGAMSEDPYNTKRFAKCPEDRGVPGYRGFLNRNSVTIAEVLKEAGYHTYMVGKWHVGMHGQEKWPLQRGFERYYGILSGASSYLKPQGDRNLTLDNTSLPAPEQPYYTTDAFTDYALDFLESQTDENPFFLYVAYNAPHWPLHAKNEDIRKFVGKYKKGWQKIREARWKRMVKMGLVDKKWGLAQWEARDWNELTEEEKTEMDRRMAVYAAQVHCMDYNVGRITKYLEEKGQLENTLIVFLSDNGACAEPHTEKGSGTVDLINAENEVWRPSYGLPWAQVSNTPYRKYKVRAYEGGTNTPFIISWPAKYKSYKGELRHNRAFLPDIMATFIETAQTRYPVTYHGGKAIKPLQGTSLIPALRNPEIVLHEYIFGEHFDNCVVWWKNWKAVKDQNSKEWELFDIEKDRTERVNLSFDYPDILHRMTDKWKEWAEKSNVYPKR